MILQLTKFNTIHPLYTFCPHSVPSHCAFHTLHSLPLAYHLLQAGDSSYPVSWPMKTPQKAALPTIWCSTQPQTQFTIFKFFSYYLSLVGIIFIYFTPLLKHKWLLNSNSLTGYLPVNYFSTVPRNSTKYTADTGNICKKRERKKWKSKN